MLTIRAGQMAAFQAEMERSVVIQFAHYIRTRYPDYFREFTDAGVRDFVTKVFCTARRFRVNRTLDFVVFLEFSVMYGPDFHEQTWAARILSRPDVDAYDKMSALRLEVLQSLGEI